MRIGVRRTIAQEIRKHVDVSRKHCGFAHGMTAPDGAALEKVEHGNARRLGGGGGLGVGRMRAHEMVDPRSRG